MLRRVEPEWLDELPPDDPRAIHSRRDLRRVNWWMNHAGLVRSALATLPPPARIVEVGAGDGAWLLSLVRAMKRQWPGGEVQLIDQQNLLARETREEFARFGWRAKAVQTDVFDWLARPREPVDLLLANLFLHHFQEPRLGALLAGIAVQCDCFAACEPRRTASALGAARLLGLIGCNAVTRHDAVISVRAGFAGQELSRLWPARADWRVEETSAGLFSHRFIARRVKA